MRTSSPSGGFYLIPTRLHAVLDYLMGALLMAAPWLFGFADQAIPMAVAVVMGGGVIGYSLFTRYGLVRPPMAVYGVLPFNAHLAMDLLGGLFLIVSPWLCMFAGRIAWPHVVFGLLEVGAVILTGFRASPAEALAHQASEPSARSASMTGRPA